MLNVPILITYRKQHLFQYQIWHIQLINLEEYSSCILIDLYMIDQLSNVGAYGFTIYGLRVNAWIKEPYIFTYLG